MRLRISNDGNLQWTVITLWCWNQSILEREDQYMYGNWCTGSWHSQAISCHGIDCREKRVLVFHKVRLNSSPPSAAYMCRRTRSALVQVMACRLFNAKSLPEPMLTYKLSIGPFGTNYGEILIKIPIFSFKKMHLKMLFGKWKPFCLCLNVLKLPLSSHCWEIMANTNILLLSFFREIHHN